MSVQVFFFIALNYSSELPFYSKLYPVFFYPLYKVCAGPSGGSAEFNPSATTVELND